MIGDGSVETGNFDEINWGENSKYLEIEVDEGNGYVNVGTVQLLSVPYSIYSHISDSSGIAEMSYNSNYANEAYTANVLGSSSVYSTTSDTLFVVKDHDGNVVFAVFPDGAEIIVNETAKGKVGGFAVSGRSPAKADMNILRVTTDSTRIYVNDTVSAKGKVGGFAVSGRSPAKSVGNELLYITADSTRIYVNESSSKGKVGGFAVSGRSPAKGTVQPMFIATTDSTRIFTQDSIKGFGVRDFKNGNLSSYMQLSPLNYFIGHESGLKTTGKYNNFFGYQSGFSNTTGSNNVFMGYQSGYGMETGLNNIILVHQAGKLSTEGNYNAIIGAYAGYENNGDYNVFIGYQSGYSNVSGADSRYSNYNTFIGYQTGKSNTTGWHNLIIGYQAGLNNQTATNQFFIGDNSGENLTAGYANTFLGHLTGRFSTDCQNNTFLGYQSGYWNETGDNNVYIGNISGWKVLGSNNTFVGTSTGGNNVNGSGNVFIGYAAGYNELGSDKLYIDNSSTSSPLIYGDFTNGSERVQINGDLHATGDITSGGTTVVPDYVFENNYELETIEDHANSMWTNKHLPALKSAAQIQSEGKFNLNERREQMLEELEKAHIYIEQLNNEIKLIKSENEVLKQKVHEILELLESN